MAWIKAAKKSDIPGDTGYRVILESKEIALFQLDGKIYALDHSCAHEGGPLAEGGIHEGRVVCPWHGWEFDIQTGACDFDPTVRQRVYPVREEGDDIYVDVS